MTEFRVVDKPAVDVDALVVPAFPDQPPPTVSADFLAGCGFTAKQGEVLQLPGSDSLPTMVLLGLGARDSLDIDGIRRTSACLARAAGRHARLAVNVSASAGELPTPADIRATIEGFLLGGYRFSRYQTAIDRPVTKRVDLIVPGQVAADEAVRTGQRLAEAVLLARDLVNEPGEALTPELFADRAAATAKMSSLDCEVWDKDRIAAERLGGLIAVSRGSPRPPCLVRVAYQPERPTDASVSLVGKGVTFDAGGLSLKPNADMAEMKADMAGAATVLAAMSLLADLDCPVRVDGWLPLTENMPSADPIRVGDIIQMRNGRTVEIRNADAEGRLIMADALVLSGERTPDAIIDVATLTDAAAVALGRKIAAVMGNNEHLVAQVCNAGAVAGEPLWPLPLPDDYVPQLESKIADLVNYTIGNRHGTALLAGLFLREFIPPGIPWAHLDIQGTAVCDADDGEWVTGGTGFGVRTLAQLLRDLGHLQP